MKIHINIIILDQQGNEKLKTKWGDEAEFKLRIAHQIKTGLQQQKYAGYKCKSVMVVMGENSKIFDEIRCAVLNSVPIIVVRGSAFANQLIHKLKTPLSAPTNTYVLTSAMLESDEQEPDETALALASQETVDAFEELCVDKSKGKST